VPKFDIAFCASCIILSGITRQNLPASPEPAGKSAERQIQKREKEAKCRGGSARRLTYGEGNYKLQKSFCLSYLKICDIIELTNLKLWRSFF
jgi:hypothetical protein